MVSSGNDLPVIDLRRVSRECAAAAAGADLVVLEGMGRSIETNLHACLRRAPWRIGCSPGPCRQHPRNHQPTTNQPTSFLHPPRSCDQLNIGMIKHPEVAAALGGRLYDCVVQWRPAGAGAAAPAGAAAAAAPAAAATAASGAAAAAGGNGASD